MLSLHTSNKETENVHGKADAILHCNKFLKTSKIHGIYMKDLKAALRI